MVQRYDYFFILNKDYRDYMDYLAAFFEKKSL